MEYTELMAWADLLMSMLLSPRIKGSNVGGVPVDTGNLRNTIELTYNHIDNSIVISIGGEVAPYVFETNEPWVHRKGKNPNEAWLDNILSQFARLVAEKQGGRVISNV